MKKVDLIACCVYEGAFQSICQNLKEAIEYRAEQEAAPVSYTHLDVYKRQAVHCKSEKFLWFN